MHVTQNKPLLSHDLYFAYVCMYDKERSISVSKVTISYIDNICCCTENILRYGCLVKLVFGLMRGH